MSQGQSHFNNVGTKPCKTLSSYPVKYPRYTTFCIKNFSNQVDFLTEEKWPCKNTWYRDEVKLNHIRNRRLLDLPYKTPKCCSDIYNIVGDRQKLNKLKRYALTRPIRTPVSSLEMEEPEVCEPGEGTAGTEDTGPCSKEDAKVSAEGVCFPVLEGSDNGSKDEDSADEYRVCSSGSVSECSGCSTLGGGRRSKRHKVLKKDWRDLLQVSKAERCRDTVAAELRKHRLGYDMSLKLKKVF